MGRGPARCRVWLGPLVATVAGVLVCAAPSSASAQAQEAIERGRTEVEDARDLLGCFRTYLRDSRAPGADLRLRACAMTAHGRVTTVSVAAIRNRARCLAVSIQRVAVILHRAENGSVTDALDEARAALAECASEVDRREARL